MNVHDSDRMEGVLRAAGGAPVERAEEADLVVFNTCSVREKAEQKLRSEVGKLAPLKRARPDMVLAVAGCVAQQEGDKLLDRVKHLDLVVGPDNIAELPALLMEQMSGGPCHPTPSSIWRRRGFLGIAGAWACAGGGARDDDEGCDERCSFCVVPTTRGPERCRPARDVVDEVRRFARARSARRSPARSRRWTASAIRSSLLRGAATIPTSRSSLTSCAASRAGSPGSRVFAIRGRTPNATACSHAPTRSSTCSRSTCTSPCNQALA